MELRDFLQQQNANFTDETSNQVTIQDFGDWRAEYAALREGAALFPLLDSAPLRLTGADRLEFLQGQISNDVKKLATNMTHQSLLLNHKGHAQALLHVFRRDDDLFVVSEDGAGDVLRTHLERHIIFDDVKIHDLREKIYHFSLQGVQAVHIIQQVFAEGAKRVSALASGSFIEVPWHASKILLSPQKRSVQGGFDIYMLARDAVDVLESFQTQGATLAGDTVLGLTRVEAGNANVKNEAANVPIPQEAGLERYISYTKGCYLGQEIMARLEARVISQNKLRRGLARLRFEEKPASVDLMQEGKSIGHISTLVEHPEGYYLALAILNKGITSLQGAVIDYL